MDTLPRPAPSDPLPLAERWLAEAERDVAKNPWAMALASVSESGRPSVRYVLLKHFSADDGIAVFYTNYGSRKAEELESAGSGAGALYWPHAGRQLRLEGRIERSPPPESDAYFASRPRLSQLNAWASRQSRPIDSPDRIQESLTKVEADFAGAAAIPRPAGWGGYRLLLDAIEFWVEGTGRFHERLRYTRAAAGDWKRGWLQP